LHADAGRVGGEHLVDVGDREVADPRVPHDHPAVLDVLDVVIADEVHAD
jgi:hypothetical protein